MPNTPSAYRLWPQHALSEPSHALGLPSSHTWQPSGDAPAALSEPRHTLGLPLSYKRSPLQTSDAMPSSLTPACPLSSSSRRALTRIGHASPSMPSAGSVMPHLACPQRDRACLIQHALSKRRPCLIRHALSGIGHASSSMPSAGSVMPHLAALSWIALGQPSAGSPCPSCACLSDAPPLELLKVSRHLPSLSPQPPRAPALQAMSACPQSEGELTYLWHSERAPMGARIAAS